MAKKPESRRQLRIRKALERRFPGSFWFKVHGGPFQMAGLPDLLGCVEGLFCGFEVKEPKGSPSDIQLERIDQIRAAGGYAAVVVTAAEAIAVVEEALLVAKTRRPLLSNSARCADLIRAGDREDVRDTGRHRASRRRRRPLS